MGKKTKENILFPSRKPPPVQEKACQEFPWELGDLYPMDVDTNLATTSHQDKAKPAPDQDKACQELPPEPLGDHIMLATTSHYTTAKDSTQEKNKKDDSKADSNKKADEKHKHERRQRSVRKRKPVRRLKTRPRKRARYSSHGYTRRRPKVTPADKPLKLKDSSSRFDEAASIKSKTKVPPADKQVKQPYLTSGSESDSPKSKSEAPTDKQAKKKDLSSSEVDSLKSASSPSDYDSGSDYSN